MNLVGPLRKIILISSLLIYGSFAISKTLSPKDVFIEKSKLQRLQAAFKNLDQNSQSVRKDKSKALRSAAMEEYRAGKFRDSQRLYVKALRLDPTDTNNYLDLGITYYRLDQHYEAITKFQVAEGIIPPEREEERRFFLGLTYLKMKDDPSAKVIFESLLKVNDQIFTPSSHFYLGVLAMKTKAYDSAMKHFEMVLDTSKDTKMDAKAEEYIEKIIQFRQLEQARKKKLRAFINSSVLYDSNVLYAPDGDASSGIATNSGGFRVGTAGFIDYKMSQTNTSSWNIRYTTSLMYSLDEAFIASDPFSHNIKSPYTMSGKWGEKMYRLQFSPGYEFVYMDANSTGNRFNEMVLSGIIFSTNLILFKDSKKITSYALEFRNDDSKLLTDAASDADAFKATLSGSQRYSLTPTGSKSFNYGGGVGFNSAKGSDKKYLKLDLSAGYTAPLESWKDAGWNIALAVYQQNYPDHTSKRQDFNITFSGGISRPINKDWGWSSALSYSNNASNVSRNQYSKYSITGNINYNWSE